jgi:hypothetical protein
LDEPQPIRNTPPWWTDPTENVKDLAQDIKAIVAASMQRQDDLRAMESRHVRELLDRDKSHAKELRAAESARIDAIRDVDVGAVQRAAEVAATQAAALAAQVTATADAFRLSISAALEPIQKDIRDLRDAQSRGVGVREQVVESRDVRGESRLNTGTLITMGLLAVAVLSLILLYATKK